LQLSRHKTVKILNFCKKRGRFFVECKENEILISCPKLIDLCDEYTQKKIKSVGTVSGQCRANVRVEEEVEVDKDKKRPHAGAHDLSAGEHIPKHKQEHIYIEEKELFALWNKLKIIVHKDIKPLLPHLSSKLKTYNLVEISKAMENFALVLHGSKYYWSYKWDLKKFLTQANAMDRFLPINFNQWDFLNKEEKERGKKNDEQHDRFKRKNNEKAFKGNHSDWPTE